jgi:chromosome segregation ATPase
MTTDSPKGGFEELLDAFETANDNALSPFRNTKENCDAYLAARDALKAHNEGLEKSLVEMRANRDYWAEQCRLAWIQRDANAAVIAPLDEQIIKLQHELAEARQFYEDCESAGVQTNEMVGKLQAELKEARAAIRSIDVQYFDGCPFCRAPMYFSNDGKHEPDCFWTRCAEGNELS